TNADGNRLAWTGAIPYDRAAHRGTPLSGCTCGPPGALHRPEGEESGRRFARRAGTRYQCNGLRQARKVATVNRGRAPGRTGGPVQRCPRQGGHMNTAEFLTISSAIVPDRVAVVGEEERVSY